MRHSVLHITYDGLLEPLGQSQVVAYAEGLARDYAIHLLSFEKPDHYVDQKRIDAMRERLKAAGIGWTWLAYHKSPSVPATAFDICHGALRASLVARRIKASIIHARGDVPAIMAQAACRASGARFLYDMRGFWADERVDGGLWPANGGVYRTAKSFEDYFVRHADHIVTLTNAAEREVTRWPCYSARKPPLTVIPTCADLELFAPGAQPPASGFVLGYVGSIGTWYLLDEIVTFFLALRAVRPDARMLFVNRNEHETIRKALLSRGIGEDAFDIVAAERHEVPKYISRMHAAAAIIKPSYSKLSSAPTKFGEYLGCGVPCVGNAGVGDMKEIIDERRVGVVLTDFTPGDHARAVAELLALVDAPDISERCVQTARDLFSLDIGVERYAAIYASLCAQRAAERA